MIGGNAGIKPRLADVLSLIDKVVTYYKENDKNYERMGMMMQRLGVETVKQVVLA